MPKPIPLLSDFEPSRVKFQAGDRVLCRISCNIDEGQYRKMVRAIEKYVRADVRVLIVNCLTCQLIRRPAGLPLVHLVKPEQFMSQEEGLGVANLNCSVIELDAADQIDFSVPVIQSEPQRRRIERWLREWVGKDVEIQVMDKAAMDLRLSSEMMSRSSSS